MYLDHFHLKEHPFQITPDSDFLYMSAAHSRAKAYMDYSIRNRDGFVVITGEVGAGKTTLIRKLLSEFDDNVVVAKIFQTQLDETQFLQAVLVEFGLNPFNAGKVELMDMLSSFLVESFLKRKQLVLIVDEAQNLNRRVLEEIRMMSGLETEKQKILHVILVGQPELNETLDAPGLEQLTQRVRLRFHIAALTEAEAADYVYHRLRIAGAANPEALFARDAIPAIYEYTGGIPRLINTLCDTALTCAFADDSAGVDEATVKSAVLELQWKPFGAVAAAHDNQYRGYWGMVVSARFGQTGALWLNSGGRDDMSVCVPEQFVNELYERFRITDEEELAGTYALVLGTLRTSQGGKKYVQVEDLGFITLR